MFVFQEQPLEAVPVMPTERKIAPVRDTEARSALRVIFTRLLGLCSDLRSNLVDLKPNNIK